MSSENSYEPVNLFFTINEPENGSDTKKCPIIFVHGLLSNHRTWNFVKYKIANKTKRKAYSLDLRNHGQSEYSEHFTWRHVMVDIENFMKSEHIPKALFVAHSIASRPLMGLALEKPELVEKLVVEDMTLVDTASYEKRVEKMSFFTQSCDRFIRNAPANISENDFHKRTLPLIKQFFPQARESYSDNLAKLPLKTDQSGKITWDMNADVVIDSLRNIKRFALNLSNNPEYLGNTLFLFGDKSPIALEDGEDTILKHFPNAQFYVFKGGFHTFHVEFTELFTELVSKFIEE